MGLPACFESRVMGPLPPAGLSEMTMVDEACSRDTDPASRTATSYSTVASRNPNAPRRASDAPNLLFYPVSDKRKAFARIADGKIVHPPPSPVGIAPTSHNRCGQAHLLGFFEAARHTQAAGTSTHSPDSPVFLASDSREGNSRRRLRRNRAVDGDFTVVIHRTLRVCAQHRQRR